MRTIAIIQARMQSQRFPGKVLADIAGKPMLLRVVERARRCLTLDQVIVATSTHNADNPIIRLCEQHDIPRFRGDEADVLKRYYQCAQAFSGKRIVRITADCPLVDPGIISTLLRIRGKSEFASNIYPHRDFPDGLDVEVFDFPLLQRAHEEATSPEDREHVTPWMHRHCTNTYACLSHDPTLSTIRWTVDEPADLDFPIAAYQQLIEPFTWQDTLAVWKTYARQ